MNKKLRVAIVGTGFGAYGIYPAFAKNKECEIVAICSSNKLKVKSIANKLKIPNYYDSYQLMLEKENIDILAIATNPIIQEKIIKLAIGKVNLFCEKPLGVSFKNLKKYTTKNFKKKYFNTIDLVYPEIREFKKAKKIITKSKSTFHCKVNWLFKSSHNNKFNSWKKEVTKGGGLISLYGSHTIYYLEYFFGKIIRAKKKNETKNSVTVHFFFKNKHQAIVKIGSNSKLSKHEINFKSNNSIFTLVSNDPLRFDGFSLIDGAINPIVMNEIFTKPVSKSDKRFTYVAKIVKRFINQIIYGKKIVPSFEDGLRNLYWINTINKQDIKK